MFDIMWSRVLVFDVSYLIFVVESLWKRLLLILVNCRIYLYKSKSTNIKENIRVHHTKEIF